ncbi:MAG TPA: sulfotransferase, partial [Thermomicrobiales bacterium]|nr:sulfotransferase [Thermomicrobiales bacterium]
MAVVEVHKVAQAAPQLDKLRGFNIDAPRVGPSAVYDIEIAGWAIGAAEPIEAVEVHAEGAILRKVPLDQMRPDVARDYPDAPGAERSGFRTWVSVVGLEPGVDLQARAVFASGARTRLGAIKLTHEPLRASFQPKLRPIMLTTMGRAGTTWTMRLLSEHPQIVIHRWHPYELRTARYWWHMIKTLAEPRDPYRSAQADFFQTNKQWIGYNPFYPEPIAVTPGLREWMGRDYVEQLAEFGMRMADETYLKIAAGQNQPNPVYLAEKHRADTLPWLVWELYPNAKEIFLVRDFRDVISSMLAFNVKHGRQVFGPPHVKSDEDFIRFMRSSTIRNLERSYPKRKDRAHLIRYEDLIGDPATTLRSVLTYLELGADEATV